MEESPKSIVNLSLVIVYTETGSVPSEKKVVFLRKVLLLPGQIEILAS